MALDMNPEIRAQWCAALRSGDYAQGRHALREGDEYCCLGVLCDLAVKADVLAPPVNKLTLGDDDIEHPWWFYDGRCDYLPGPVRDWAGLESLTPQASNGDYLANLNDEGKTFAEIADLIDGGAS